MSQTFLIVGRRLEHDRNHRTNTFFAKSYHCVVEHVGVASAASESQSVGRYIRKVAL